MPPCGYRNPAIDGIAQFLLDNLEYFIELYTEKGMSIENAIATEFGEIARIRNGVRGGAWSAIVVEINERFYSLLLNEQPSNWEDVRRIGKNLVATATADLRSLTLDGGHRRSI